MSGITLYGIPFQHRRASLDDYVMRDFAQFGAFAALCNARGLQKFVGSVFYDHNPQWFEIAMHDDFKSTVTEREVWACAEASLGQFVLFGVVGHLGGSES